MKASLVFYIMLISLSIITSVSTLIPKNVYHYIKHLFTLSLALDYIFLDQIVVTSYQVWLIMHVIFVFVDKKTTLCLIMELSIEMNSPHYFGFVDYGKALGSINKAS